MQRQLKNLHRKASVTAWLYPWVILLFSFFAVVATRSEAVMPPPAAPPVFTCLAYGGGSGPCPGCATDANPAPPCNGTAIVDAASLPYRNASGCIITGMEVQALRDIAAALNAGCGGNWGLSVKTGGTQCGGYACDVVCQVDAGTCPPAGQLLVDVWRGEACGYGTSQWLVYPCRCFCEDAPPPPGGGARPCEPV